MSTTDAFGEHITGPTPPTNVRMHTATGDVMPIECVYEGQDDEGMHVWAATFPIDVGEASVGNLSIDVLPPRTSVKLYVTGRRASA